jgi:hypothetical protein
MKKIGFLFALIALVCGVNASKAQSHLPAGHKVILVNVDPTTTPEVRGKLLAGLTGDAKLNGYIVADKSFIVTVPNDEAKINKAKGEIAVIFPTAPLSVISTIGYFY